MGISRARLGGGKLPQLITEEEALAGTDTKRRMFSPLRVRQAARYAVDVVDARSGLPAASSDGADDGRIAIRNDGFYTIEVTPHYGTDPTGSWAIYGATGFRGAHSRYNVPASPQAGQTYYNISERAWYQGAMAEGSRVRWIHAADPENWIGHFDSQDEALARAGGDGLAYTGSEVETLSSFAAGSNAYTERRWVRRSDHERERELIYEDLDFNNYYRQAHLLDLRRSMTGERNAFFIFHYFNLPETITAERRFVSTTTDHGTLTAHINTSNTSVSFAVGDEFSSSVLDYDGKRIVIEGLSSGAHRIVRENGTTVYDATSRIVTLPVASQEASGSFTVGETVRITLTNPFSHSAFSQPIPVEEWLALPRSWGTAGNMHARNLDQKIFVVISRLSNTGLNQGGHARMALGRVTDSQMVTTFSHELEVSDGTPKFGVQVYLHRGA
ncbi:MAG: hypothetical protein OXT74_16630 [Candidatus Poribacteria bacterium]|nr:hypothetical protein [Candidatus Poribacteria bacterium]